jgi:two-component system chemotaxis sensor kinase CheA
LRNAVDHGIELPAERESAAKPQQGVILLRATRSADMIEIEVRDDGAGIDHEAIRETAARRGLVDAEALTRMAPGQLQSLIFAPGFSTRPFVTAISGRGVGMDVVRANVERLKGELAVSSVRGEGTQVRIRLPQSLATLRILLLRTNGHYYGLPATSVVECRKVAPSAIFRFDGRDTVLHRGLPVAVSSLSQIMKLDQPFAGYPATDTADTMRDCVLLRAGGEVFGLFVDELLAEQEMVVKPLSPIIPRGRDLRGAAILSSGEICMVLEPQGLMEALPDTRTVVQTVTEARAQRKLILLAEDSVTTRAQEIRILEGAGYEVVAATDGLDAMGKLATRRFDAVVTDINMPRMDGLQLAAEIRGLKQYADLPIILVTSLASDEDKRRGLEVGANAYITKPEFDQTLLLDCLERVVG